MINKRIIVPISFNNNGTHSMDTIITNNKKDKIDIYTKVGCSKCKAVISIFDKKNIEYTLYHIEELERG
jgi:hypothetical protein